MTRTGSTKLLVVAFVLTWKAFLSDAFTSHQVVEATPRNTARPKDFHENTRRSHRQRHGRKSHHPKRLVVSATSGTYTGSILHPTTTVLRYRNREAHEEQATVATGTAPTTAIDSRPAAASTDHAHTTKNASSSVAAGINFSMLLQLCRSQVALLLLVSAVWAIVAHGGDIESSWQWGVDDWSWTTNGVTSLLLDTNKSNYYYSLLMARLAFGALAAVPVIATSHYSVEASGHRPAHFVQFATTHAVMSLFGRRKKHTERSSSARPTTTFAVVLCSLALTAVTATSEEFTFRYFLPASINVFTGSTLIALAGQAVLFGLAHAHPGSSREENAFVVEMQLWHGIWYGVIFLLAGGDLLPCIISHMLYDMHVFVETWHRVNEQMDWAESQQQNLRHETKKEATLEFLRRETKITDEAFNHLKLFFLSFDQQHQTSLSLDDVQRAAAYAFWHDPAKPDQERVQHVFEVCLQESHYRQERRLGLAEFIRLLLILREQAASATAVAP